MCKKDERSVSIRSKEGRKAERIVGESVGKLNVPGLGKTCYERASLRIWYRKGEKQKQGSSTGTV